MYTAIHMYASHSLIVKEFRCKSEYTHFATEKRRDPTLLLSRYSDGLCKLVVRFDQKCNSISFRSYPQLPHVNCASTQHLHRLIHWDRVMHICVGKLTTIGSDNGLSPERRQAITWTNAGILLIGPLGTNFNWILIEILIFSFKKMHVKSRL